MIKSKNPQLSIVISQSCNSLVNGLSAKETVSATSSKLESSSSSNYQKLFRDLRGTIIASSSSPGEYSWSNDALGSFFTNAFLIELGKIVGGTAQVNWEDLFKNTATTKRKNLGKSNSEPQWEVSVKSGSNNNNNPPKGQIPVAQNTDNFVSDLLAIANTQNDEWGRIQKVNPTLSRYFAKETAKIEVIGRNGTTLVDRQPAKKFLQRLSTTRNLVNIAIIEKKINQQGKITELKIHEIYYK